MRAGLPVAGPAASPAQRGIRSGHLPESAEGLGDHRGFGQLAIDRTAATRSSVCIKQTGCRRKGKRQRRRPFPSGAARRPCPATSASRGVPSDTSASPDPTPRSGFAEGTENLLPVRRMVDDEAGVVRARIGQCLCDERAGGEKAGAEQQYPEGGFHRDGSFQRGADRSGDAAGALGARQGPSPSYAAASRSAGSAAGRAGCPSLPVSRR